MNSTTLKRPMFNRLFAFVLMAGLAISAWAQDNSIESVNTSQQGAGVVVRITLKTPLAAVPATFAVNNPSRIALDFPKTSSNLGKSTVDANQGDLRSINVVQAGDRSRVVLNLKRNVQYTTNIEGNTVVVSLDSPALISSTSAPAATA